MDRQPEPYTLDTKGSIEQAKVVKDRATVYFMQKNYALAGKVFEKANKYLQNCTSKIIISFSRFHTFHFNAIGIFLFENSK